MRTFFARIDSEGTSTRVDALLEDLRTGTYIRITPDLRAGLDRFRLLEYAIRHAQGRSGELGTQRDQDRIAVYVLEHGRLAPLIELACLWPGDALVLAQKGSPPTPYANLTEGLRALAIKEISFADSDRPVITDQPEDAVPTRAVFESLVPTLREQRIHRQFIVVSHDANIVVAGDVERVWVLQAQEDGRPCSGGLDDPIVRKGAMEHFEGGQAAFRLRAERYARATGAD